MKLSVDASKSYEEREKELLTLINEHHKKEVKTVFGMMLPKRFVDTLLHIIQMQPTIQASHVTKEDRKKIAHLLSGELTISLIQRRP